MTSNTTHFKYQCRRCHKPVLQPVQEGDTSKTPIPTCCGGRGGMAYLGLHVEKSTVIGAKAPEDKPTLLQPETKAIWTSTSASSLGPVEVQIVGPTDESLYDRFDVGQMYDIRLPDGSAECAFEDELAPGDQ